MSNFDDYITGEQGGIPWAQAAAFFVELKDVAVPEPVLTKEAKAGLLKLARIRKVAQTPEEMQGMTQEAAMTDPNVVQAMDYQEMAAERGALQQTVQGMQQQLMQSAQAQQQAEQQVQQMTANTEALQGQLEQANAGRQQAMEQAVMAKDQALTEVVNQQQHRQQIMQTADQLAMQLKQVAATSPNEAMAQQQQQQAMAAEAQGGGVPQGGSAKAQQEAQEAQQAGVNAQVQGEQAQAAQQQDAAKQEQAAAMQQQGGAQPGQGADPTAAQDPAAAQAEQQQQGAAGAPMPKQGADTVAEAAIRILEKRAGSVSSAYKLGRVEAGIKTLAKELGVKAEKISTKGLSLPTRAAYHVGKHRNKYLAGAGGGVGVGGVALAAKKLKERKEKHAHEKTAAPLGIGGRLAYTAGGAALGAGHAAAEQATHRRKFNKNQASNDEIDRRADQAAALAKGRRNPTYLNKLRYSTARYKADLEQADRQHPGGAIARGAAKGAIIGGLGGGAAHSLGGWVKALAKNQSAGKAAAKAAAKAAKAQ